MSSLERATGEANISPERKRHESGDEVVISDSSSTSSSADFENNDSPNRTREVYRGLPGFHVRMLNLCREFFVFCLVMVTLSALTKDPPKVTKPPAAYPFFPVGSIVRDWYRGQISKAIEITRSNDVAFIMYYAPWDADSLAARSEFEIAAGFMGDTISFAAVNCWQPYGECKTQYPKVYKWPVLIAYPSHGRGVQYNGPIKAPHIISFLKRICNPLVRITDSELDIFDDVFVVAKVNTSPGSFEFAVLYTAALNYLERDPQQRITFYVKPSAVSEPVLDLHLWNGTLRYPILEKKWTSEAILQWITKNIGQVTTWILPSGTKSSALAAHLQNNPALILFTPKNPLHTTVDYYNMLQEIGLDYNNCDEENILVKMNAESVKLKRAENRELHKVMKAACKPKTKTPDKKIIANISSVWANTSTCSKSGGKLDCDVVIKEKIDSICGKSRECLRMESEPSVNTVQKKCGVSENYISMLTGQHDAKSAENLLASLKRESCKQFLMAESYFPAIFERIDERMGENITGLHCKHNNSLSLVAMDSILHYSFAERLGIDLSKRTDKSAVVIVNDLMESHHIMDSQINTHNVKQFIYNYTKNTLNRSLDSLVTIGAANPQNHFIKDVAVDKTDINIKELNTTSFLPTVSQKNMAVIVFYYSKQCSFCSGVAYNYLTVAKKLSRVGNLMFARIDGETNNLPWEYTMESYPTILLFPAKSKSESRVFPSNVPITVPNLIGFIMANINPSLKLNVMWSVCNQTKLPEEKLSCNSSLLGETLTVIDKTLREWRKSDTRQRQTHLHSLRQLRQLHLLFAHASEKYSLIEAHFKKLHAKLGYGKAYSNVGGSATVKTHYRDEL